MRSFCALLILASVHGASVANAQLELVPEPEVPCVFGGGARTLRVVLRNPAAQPLEVALSNRLFQATSSTLAPAGDLQAWKKVRVLPGQTIIDSVTVEFPAVRGPVRFQVTWHGEQGRAMVPTEVMVYPTNLLAPLATLSPDKPMGAYDPQNQLKPLLQAAKVEFVDLEREDLEHFDGPLAVLGPFRPRDPLPPGLAATIRKRAQAGMGIVWIQPPSRLPAPITYPVSVDKGVVVVAPASAVTDLAANPIAQLNLLRFARLALKQESLDLPELKP